MNRTVMYGVLLFCLLVGYSMGDLEGGFNLINPPGNLKSHYLSGPLNIQPKTFNVTGHLVYLLEGCVRDHDLEDIKDALNGSIVVVAISICVDPPHHKAQKLAEYGAVGMVIVQYDGQVGSNYILDDGEHAIPSVSIALYDGIRIREHFHGKTTASNITAVLITTDRNPWWHLTEGPAGIIIQIVLISYVLVCIIFALYKLNLFIQYKGIELSVSQVCLSLDIIASILRLIFCINPFTFHDFWPTIVSTIIGNVSIPVAMAGTLLMTFYWNDILNSSTGAGLKNLKKMKIPYAIAVGVMSLAVIISSCVSALGGQGTVWNAIVLVVAVLVLTAVAIFFLHTGRKVVRLLERGSTLRQTKSDAVRKLTVLLMTAGGAIIWYNISFILLVTPANQISPGPSLFLVVFHLLAAISTSFFQILAFQSPKTLASSRSSGPMSRSSAGGQDKEIELTPTPDPETA